LGGSYLIELVALNDFNQVEEAVVQARKMAVDDDVLGVLGGWSPQTARSVAREYERLGLAFLAPGLEVLGEQVPVPDDPAFVDGFLALSGGAPPGSVAVWTYVAANRLLDAIDETVRTEGRPTRLGVQEALAANH
jgi:ABC-type branched-subunit amino acid transport system substrate-binding protein